MSNAAGLGVGRAKHPKFREMQDRFQDDPGFLGTESEKDDFFGDKTRGLGSARFATGNPVLQGGGHSANILGQPSPRGQWM